MTISCSAYGCAFYVPTYVTWITSIDVAIAVTSSETANCVPSFIDNAPQPSTKQKVINKYLCIDLRLAELKEKPQTSKEAHSQIKHATSTGKQQKVTQKIKKEPPGFGGDGIRTWTKGESILILILIPIIIPIPITTPIPNPN